MPAISGNKHHAAKLNSKTVAGLLARYAKTTDRRGFCSKEAEKYGVSRHTIYAVLTGRTWRAVTAK